MTQAWPIRKVSPCGHRGRFRDGHRIQFKPMRDSKFLFELSGKRSYLFKGKAKVISCSVVPDSLRPHRLYSPPSSSVHGIPQARILEWVAMPFSRRSSLPRCQTRVSQIVGRFFTIWATREAFWRKLSLWGHRPDSAGSHCTYLDCGAWEWSQHDGKQYREMEKDWFLMT